MKAINRGFRQGEPTPENIDRAIRLRRRIGLCFLVALLSTDLFATGLFGGSERALAVARSIVLPGLPIFEWQPVLGVLIMAAAFFAVVAWLRWGLDWLLILVVASSLIITSFVMPLHHQPVEPDSHSHDSSHSHSH